MLKIQGLQQFFSGFLYDRRKFCQYFYEKNFDCLCLKYCFFQKKVLFYR